jgi:hypothetical protein
VEFRESGILCFHLCAVSGAKTELRYMRPGGKSGFGMRPEMFPRGAYRPGSASVCSVKTTGRLRLHRLQHRKRVSANARSFTRHSKWMKPDSYYFLHVNSLGYHEVFPQRQKGGRRSVLAPAVSQFDKRSLINTYDVSDLLQNGKNEIILWLGSGWYTQGLPGVANNGPVVRAQLEKVESNQREIILTTDENWQGRNSSYTRHGNWRPNQFGGEIVEGTLVGNDLITENPGNPFVEMPEFGRRLCGLSAN